MEQYLPYIVTVLCSLISGIASYSAARRQTKADLEKLQKQHELDIEKEREMFAMQKEQLGANFTNTLLTEAMKMPEVRQQFAQGVRSSGKKHK